MHEHYASPHMAASELLPHINASLICRFSFELKSLRGNCVREPAGAKAPPSALKQGYCAPAWGLAVDPQMEDPRAATAPQS